MGILFSGLVAALVSVVGLLIGYHMDRTKYKRDMLEESLDDLLKIAIQYPYVESKEYTSNWLTNKLSVDEKVLRYDLYCTLLFNYLARFCQYYDYDKKRIESELDIKPWVRMHKNYWKSPLDEYENADGYDEKFRNFLKKYIED